MRRVVGRQVETLERDFVERLAGSFGHVIVDVGTGDGQAVLRRARREPQALLIGVDAVAENMRHASHRASRPPTRGGVGNALFVAAAADELPGVLAGTADEVTVVLPWGSLLRALLAADPPTVASLDQLLRAGGRLELLLSVSATDTVPGAPPLSEDTVAQLAAAFGSAGLRPLEVGPAEAADVERLGSSWARRLGIPRRRQAWRLLFGR